MSLVVNKFIDIEIDPFAGISFPQMRFQLVTWF